MLNRRQAIVAAIASGVGMIGLPSDNKLRKIYRFEKHPFGYEWRAVRMAELKIGDKFTYRDLAVDYIELVPTEQKVWLVTGEPVIKDGVWGVVANEVDSVKFTCNVPNGHVSGTIPC